MITKPAIDQMTVRHAGQMWMPERRKECDGKSLHIQADLVTRGSVIVMKALTTNAAML